MRPPACSGRLPRPETRALAAWMPKSGCGNSLLLTQSLIPPPLTYQAAPLRCSGASSTRVTQTAHTARRSRQAPVRTMWCTRASAGRQGSGSWSKLTSRWRHSLPLRTPGTPGLRPLLLHALWGERCSRPCPSGIPRWHTALPAASANVALDTQTGVGSSYIGRGEGEIGGYGSVMHDVEPGRAGSSRSRPAPKDYKPLTLPDGRLATLGTHTHRTRTHTHILAHTRRGQ